MNPLIQLKKAAPVFLIALVCFGLLPKAQAVSPAPDGGYPGFNTAEGTKALQNLTTGAANTAVGWFSLFSNAEGSFNTATGAGSLLFNTADQNTAFGAAALLFNTTGINNTAVGATALLHNTIAEENTATGAFALSSNTEGDFNTATGAFALSSNTEGDFNTATGAFALLNNTTGVENTANGYRALSGNATGVGNTAYGSQALVQTTGNNNIALGVHAGFNISTGSNNIHIGNVGAGNESGTIRIGDNNQTKTFIAGINGVNQGSPTAVFINTLTGQLGTASSSRRFKKEIKAMDQTSESILGLKPVTFHYKSDKANTPQFGLIAEEVAEVNPDLVVRNENGEIYTVRYEAVNAMLLNEFLKEHQTVQQQGATIARLEKQVAALTAGLQKVSAKIEANKPVGRTVMN